MQNNFENMTLKNLDYKSENLLFRAKQIDDYITDGHRVKHLAYRVIS